MSVPKIPVDQAEPRTELALVFPILSGMAEEVERLAAELTGPKAEEFGRSQRGIGIRGESWFLNKTPQGDSVTVYLEGEDLLRSLRSLIASETPTDRWLKSEVKRVTGVDFGSSPQLSLPRRILRYPS